MKNIGFITNSIGFGGAEKMLTFIANELSKRGNRIVIFNLDSIKGDYINEKKQYINEDISLYYIKNEKKGIFRHYSKIKEMKEICIKEKIEIIIGFTDFPNLYASIIGKILKIPSIISERGDPSKTRGNNIIKEKISMFFINRADGAVFQLENAKVYYEKRLQKRSVVIHNPIFVKDVEKNKNYDNSIKSIVSVGRLDNDQKRYDIMLKAFKLFNQKYPEYILKLYGRGRDEGQIRKWSKELKIENNVKLMGVSQNPMNDIIDDEIFLITSDYEGISNSLLEAMVIGMPCISTDHTPGGARLLINDHENGLLAPIQDEVAISKCLIEFVENRELEKTCGINAKNVIDKFDAKNIIDQWEKYIIKLCN